VSQEFSKNWIDPGKSDDTDDVPTETEERIEWEEKTTPAGDKYQVRKKKLCEE
jgi:hypothetical protein